MHAHRLAGGALLVAALIAGCSDDRNPTMTGPATPSFVEDAGHNAAEHLKEVNQVSFEIENPCNGEVIVFSGTEVFQATLVDKPENLENGFSVHNYFQSQVDATGTGPLSGATYTIHDIVMANFESPSPPAPQFTATFRETAKITASNPALDFTIKALVHVLLNPGTAEFTVTKDLEGATCRG
jgi:hypothetical protein